MEASETRRIVVPFMPSLFHLSLVKIAIRLFEDFNYEIWKIILDEILHQNISRRNKIRQMPEVNKAREKLLSIPAHLRQRVVEAIMGLHSAVSQWKMDHSYVLNFSGVDMIYYWRPDGTIDRIKTVRKLLRNKDVNTRLRFDLACSYFRKHRIQSLWEKMIQSGKYGPRYFNPTSSFWIEWLCKKHPVKWRRRIPRHLDPPEYRFPIPRLSAFFPRLKPEERKKFLLSFMNVTSDDFRFCLLDVERIEENIILGNSIQRLLYLYLDWPLQSLFLEMVDRVWNFINYNVFDDALHRIYVCSKVRYDFDYCKLYVDFWNRSPNHLKEQIKSCPVFTRRLNLFLNVIRKRKAVRERLINSKKENNITGRKKWIRKNGRLQPVH